ncbi:MAG: hypothetical protein U0359_31965 [Byssovorax sp.]
MAEAMSIPAAPGNTNNVVVPSRVFNEVKTVSLEIIGDHQLLKDNATDWTNTGSVPPKPEFKYGAKSAAVSRTKKKRLAVQVGFEVWPYDAPQMPCTIKGTASFGGLTFDTSFPLRGGVQTVILESSQDLPDKIVKLSGEITWVVDNGTDGPTKADSSWGHEVFVTMDTPVDLVGTSEAGVTVKHMNAAVTLGARASSNDPHAIVGSLMGMIPGYTLTSNPTVPSQYNHPRYFNSVGGAWPIADYFAYSAECQAICRFVSATIKQVGCPGAADVVVVWADPDLDDGKTALEAPLAPGSGLGSKSKQVGGSTWHAVLVDRYPEEGSLYSFADEADADYIGLNNYEACLRFEHNGVKRYYGGGAGVYVDVQAVLLAFHALCWVRITFENGRQLVCIEKVVKRWRDRQGNVLP